MENRDPVFLIGVDGGGSKTVALLADWEGHVLGRGTGGPSNYQVMGIQAAGTALSDSIRAAFADAGLGLCTPRAICLGLSGVDRPADQAVIRAWVNAEMPGALAVIVNDAELVLAAGTPSGWGVALICGTGSIAYGRTPEGRTARAGGWGHVLGDEGSGYWIGRRALAAVMRDADGRGGETALRPRVLARFGLDRASELVPLIYDQGLALPVVASLGSLVQEARDAGDREAGMILQEAADELVLAATSVVSRLEMANQPFTFVLSGGMFHAVPWLVPEVSAGLTNLAPMASVRKLEVEPATGAVHLALALARGEANVPVYVEGCAP